MTNETNLIAGSAELLLWRSYLSEPWQLKWPKKIRQASFASLTHDELMRLGMLDSLQKRLGKIRVKLTIEEITDEKDVEKDRQPSE